MDLDVLEGLPPAERKRAEAELLALEAAFKANPLLGYQPHAKQVLFHSPPWVSHRLFAGGNRCLAEGTLVRMADGSARPIERVRVGDLVLGATEAGSCRPVRVLEAWSNGPKMCYRFRFGKRGTQEDLVATADHRVSAFHEKGHRALLPLGVMGDLSRSRWSIQRATGQSDFLEGSFEPYALLYGLLLGDGCTVNGRVSFACDDAEVLALAEQQCELFGVQMRRNPANPIQYYLSAGKAGGKPNELSRHLHDRGMACYAHEKRLPDTSDWNHESVGQMLAGLLVTDGSVWKASEGWRLGFTSVSRGLVEDVKRELERRFGVYGSTLLTQDRTKHGKKRIEYSLTIGNYQSLQRLAFSLPAVAKLKKLRRALCDWDGKQSDASRLRYRGRDEVGVMPTYDLHVDHPSHLFVLANGMIVHNSGKTTAGVVDSIIQAVDDEFVPDHLKMFRRWEPPFFCRFVTPDLGHTLHGVLLEKIRALCPAAQLRGGSFDRAWDKVLRILSFRNGSWFQFMSGDQDRDKFGGAALHRVVFDEEPPKAIRDECLWRLVDYEGEEMFLMTPFEGMDWLYEEVYEPWERGELEDGKVVVVDIDENPHMTEKGKQMALAGLTREQRMARKSGIFVNFAGLIYPEFNWERHVIPTPAREAAVPSGAEVFCGIDPGWRHMAAVIYCFLDFDDRLVVFDEIALKQSTVRQVCEEIKRRNRYWGVQPRWYVIDPASRNKNGQTGRSDQQEFSDNGIVAIPGQNAVTAGINRVKERLQADPPKLQVMTHCTELRGELKRYRWVKAGRGENEAKEEVVKKDDHLADCVRYVCAQRPLTPDRARREMSMTMKDRLLRADLARLGRRRPVDHPSGSGFFA